MPKTFSCLKTIKYISSLFIAQESKFEMKYIQKLKMNFCHLGIFNRDCDPKAKKITIATRCGLLIIFITYFLSPACYLIFEAQTPSEHSESLFFALSGLLIVFWYLVFLIQSKKFAEFFDELNSKIQTSK